MANLKKGDIVRMNYDACILGSDIVFDTTFADKAKEAGIFNEKYSYAPMPYIVGSGRFFKVLDEAIAAAEVGKEVTIEVPCQQAAGEKDPKLIETFTVKDFYKQEIRPYPGLEVKLGDRTGTVVTVGAGRVKVDFNNKLAGKDLKYTFTVTEVMESDEDKAMAIAQMDFGSNEGFKFEFGKDKISIYTPDIVKFNQNWLMTKFRIVNDMREAFGIDTIEFIEVWEKAPAAEKKE
ncbi:MAG: peptidylprolyl isomerase [Thermoplasmata archaeon]|nr:peptidylprolyl isomerase [Thermoplasmata archaeon]